MPRQARKKSGSGIYHIMLRGINRQQIFEDAEDRERFLETIENYKELCGYTIYAYCLMGNHVHILMREGKEDLTQVFKRIAGSYVYWYNWKYHRSGHLFQDRYKSEPVEDDSYFLTVLRYIHQNPVKAKICKTAELLQFRFFVAYVILSHPKTIIDIVYYLRYKFGTQKKQIKKRKTDKKVHGQRFHEKA